MKYLKLLPLAILFVTIGCSPIERQAYNTFVAAKGFLDAEKKAHPECPAHDTAACQAIDRAVAAKDALIDAAEVYCSGPKFENGGECEAPKKGSPAYDELSAKLKAAIANYQQTEKDVRGVLGQ